MPSRAWWGSRSPPCADVTAVPPSGQAGGGPSRWSCRRHHCYPCTKARQPSHARAVLWASDDSGTSGRPAPEDRAEDRILQVEALELEPQTWGTKRGRDSPGGEGTPNSSSTFPRPPWGCAADAAFLLPRLGLVTSGAGTRPCSSSPRQSPGSRSGDVTLRSDRLQSNISLLPAVGPQVWIK